MKRNVSYSVLVLSFACTALAAPMEERAFDLFLAGNGDHRAKIANVDGFSRLVIDGWIAVPVACLTPPAADCDGRSPFSGARHDSSDIKLVGTTPVALRGFWNASDGFDARAMAVAVKDDMRKAPYKFFMASVDVEPPAGMKRDEAWREWVKAGIRAFVQELADGHLSCRTVAVLLSGGQPCAIADLDAFAGEFKNAIGHQSIAAFRLDDCRDATLDLFAGSGSLDVALISDPDGQRFFAGDPGISASALRKLHGCGKMVWCEMPTDRDCGFEVWRNAHRVFSGMAGVSGLGRFLYDDGGNFSAKAVNDVRTTTARDKVMARRERPALPDVLFRVVETNGVKAWMNASLACVTALNDGDHAIPLPGDCRVTDFAGGLPLGSYSKELRLSMRKGDVKLLLVEENPLAGYVARFAADDYETKTNAIPNSKAYRFMRENVPVFECPDHDIERAYYFRWWTFRRHIRETPSGYVVSEFLPDVSWASKGNTINCAAGHHVMEGRWLRDRKYMDDYIRFLMRDGTMAGTRAYVCWLAFAILERTRITGDWAFAESLLDCLVENYCVWERGWGRRPWPFKHPDERFSMGLRPNGLFATTDDREGSENSIGGDGMRPLINSVMFGEAKAIAEIATHARRGDIVAAFNRRWLDLQRNVRKLIWNEERQFFTVLTDAGEHKSVRELFGYSPWYFGMDTKGCGAAWRFVMRTDAFLAPAGLANPEQSDPNFTVAYRDMRKTACRRDGPSWPYETSIVLTGLAKALQDGADTGGVTAADYMLLFRQYATSHRRVIDGRMVSWIDENIDPFTGECVTRRIYHIRGAEYGFERGKDYNHSTFCDMVLSGVCGIRPDFKSGKIHLKPLAPANWDYFRVSNLNIAGRDVEVVWDRTGERYGIGQGLFLFENGKVTCQRPGLKW